MQVKENEEHKVVLVDVSERGRGPQKFDGSATIPGPTASMTTPPALTVTRVAARICVGGFEMPDDGSDGCVLLIYSILLNEWIMY